MLYRKVFLWILILILLIQSVYHYTGISALKFLNYAIEIVFSIASLLVVMQKINKITRKLFYFLLLVIVFFFGLVLNGISQFQDIIKIISATIIFLSAYYLFDDLKDINRREKIKVIIISLIPFVVYLMDSMTGFQETSNSMSLFSNSNNYIFFSICCVWLMMVYNISNRFLWGFLAVSFAITSTLGAFLGIALAVAFYFRNKIFNPRFFTIFTFISVFSVGMILYSDLYLFERLRGAGNVFYVLINDYSLAEFSQISFGEAMVLSGSNDGNDVSFLFRIKLWTESLVYFFNQNIIYLLFGLGFGSIPTINSFGLVAHNDYLTWFIESGIFGFTLIIVGISFAFSKLKNTRYIIPYLAILIYFFSENLFYNFFAIAIFAFCMATSLQKSKNENITDK